MTEFHSCFCGLALSFRSTGTPYLSGGGVVHELAASSSVAFALCILPTRLIDLLRLLPLAHGYEPQRLLFPFG